MARRRRGVRVLKWVGAGMCALIAAMFVISLWWDFGYWRLSALPNVKCVTKRGVFGISLNTIPSNVVELQLKGALPPDGWFAARSGGFWADLGAQWLWPEYRSSGRISTLVVPLWIPFLALLLPTLLLWNLDRRRPRPGHCRCGYNLTGLTSGRCPECGTAAPSAPPVG